MPGPPRKPNELKRLQGNPGNKKLPELATVVNLPQISSAPSHLSDISQMLWNDIQARATWVAETDRSVLQLLCEKFDRRAMLLAKLEASDPVLYTDKGYAYANPVVGMLSTIENEIFKLLASLGLTPSDRSKLGVAEVKKASALDELIARRQNR
jgi:P27 family predicted phage terminase small subunit